MSPEAIAHYMATKENTITSAIAQKNRNEHWKCVKNAEYKSSAKEMKKNIAKYLNYK